MKLFYHIFYEISPVFLIFQFHLDNCMNLYYNCIKMINTVKTHHTVHTLRCNYTGTHYIAFRSALELMRMLEEANTYMCQKRINKDLKM